MGLLREAYTGQLQTTTFVSHQITCLLAWNSVTHIHSLYTNATHAHELLEENNNQKCVSLNLQIKEFPKEKLKINMPLDGTVAFHGPES